MIHIPIGIQARGLIRFKITNGKTGKTRTTPWRRNLITDLGLAQMVGNGGVGNANNWAAYCSVGTGVTAPNAADTTLAAKFGSQSPTYKSLSGTRNATGSPDYIVSNEFEYEFTQGNFPDGTILNEVGFGVASSGVDLVSRALISPSITVNAIDQLTVQYRIEFVVDQTERTGTINIGGGPSNVNYKIRALNAAGVDFVETSMGARSIVNSNPDVQLVGVYNANYASPGSIEDFTPAGATASSQTDANLSSNPASNVGLFAGTWATNLLNAGTLNCIKVDFRCGVAAIFFDQTIPKDNTKTLTVGVTVTFNRAP